MKVSLLTATPDAEKIMAYCARVSNPANQDNDNISGLLKYCIKNGHWSVYEHAHMTVEIETTRAISAQLLRHRSFCFQEFSQRYAEATDFETYPARRQDKKNRQNSVDDMSEEDKAWFEEAQKNVIAVSNTLYEEALQRGIAKEQARFLLPLNTKTRLYMTGNVRNWIHYIQLRTANGTQLEHKQIADAIKNIFVDNFPIISDALEWRS